MAADVQKKLTFFFLLALLLSFTTLPCGCDGSNSLPEVCTCSKAGCITHTVASRGACISGEPGTKIKSLWFQTDSVKITPSEKCCLPIHRDPAYAPNLTHFYLMRGRQQRKNSKHVLSLSHRIRQQQKFFCEIQVKVVQFDAQGKTSNNLTSQ